MFVVSLIAGVRKISFDTPGHCHSRNIASGRETDSEDVVSLGGGGRSRFLGDDKRSSVICEK